MWNAAFFTNGPVTLRLKYQPHTPTEEILGAPEYSQNLPRAAIRSKHLMVDKCAYCMGQRRSESGAPESVTLLLT